MIPSSNAVIAERIARDHLTIVNRETSARSRWIPNDEQIILWRLLEKHRHLIVAKSRKIGLSLAATEDDFLWTNCADQLGNRVRTVFAIDTDDKAQEHLERVADFADQLKVRVKVRHSAPYGLRFSNGSRLNLLTMGGEEPGRGGDIMRLHLTELPYAAHPEQAFHSLRSACTDTAPTLIETTMTPEPFTTALWRGWKRDPVTGRQVEVGTEFKRKFFSVEEHRGYRCPQLSRTASSSTHLLPVKDDDGQPKTGELIEEAWLFAQRNGFTSRETAAWWMLHALPNLCGGEMLTLMHDYPQIEAHLFVATAGRVIDVTSEIAATVDRVDVHGLSGHVWSLDIYVRPEECSGNVFVTVDTAWGRGKTRSVVLVVDIADGRILACLASSLIMYDDLARVAQMARHHYLAEHLKQKRRVDLIVEINGSGNATCHELAKIGCPFHEMDQVKNYRDHGADACVRHSKRMIETTDSNGKSKVLGPPELAEECDSLKKEAGAYHGVKDIIMTLGMALVRREEVGVRDKSWKTKRVDIMHVHHEDRMKEEARKARYMSWGRR